MQKHSRLPSWVREGSEVPQGPAIHTMYVGRLSAGAEFCRTFSFGGATCLHNPHTHL